MDNFQSITASPEALAVITRFGGSASRRRR